MHEYENITSRICTQFVRDRHIQLCKAVLCLKLRVAANLTANAPCCKIYLGGEKMPLTFQNVQETLEAAKECEYILAHPEEYKAYHDVDEMFRDLLSDD